VRKTILIFGLVGILVLGIIILNPFKQKSLPSALTLTEQASPLTPSTTLKTYSDPSGFSFSYSDNLSLLNNDLKDSNSYAELQLTAKGVNGSLILKITDSKLASLDEWAKLNKTDTDTAKEVKLGNLKALEITTKDKLLLGSLDQGILFIIEVPTEKNKDFWMEVYNKLLTDFSFAPPTQADVSSSNEVTFDGEESVE